MDRENIKENIKIEININGHNKLYEKIEKINNDLCIKIKKRLMNSHPKYIYCNMYNYGNGKCFLNTKCNYLHINMEDFHDFNQMINDIKEELKKNKIYINRITMIKYTENILKIEYDKLYTNEEKLINKLKKINSELKNNKCYLYNETKINNRNTLKLFNDIYKKYIDNEIDDNYIDNIYELYDNKKSRFVKKLEISYEIYNNNKLINSDYIFPLYIFNNIKKSELNSLIENISVNLN